MTTPPSDGQLNWGDPLNAYLAGLQATATDADTQVDNHVANIPTDPHGDRAYALGLIQPVTSGVNLPNGYVVLNSNGKVPQNLVAGEGGSGGSFTDVFDVVAAFGATGNGSTDDSGAIQNALNTCAGQGGGEVWIPSGTYALANTLIVGANTWVHLSPGAVMLRIAGVTTPQRMISNIAFPSGSTTPATGNIKISGGTWNAYGAGLSGTCTPIFLLQAQFCAIEECQVVGVPNNPGIELNGCSDIVIRDVLGTGPSASGPTVPFIRLNTSNSATTPSGLSGGLYNNADCTDIAVMNTGLFFPGTMTYGAFIGTDLTVPSQNHTNINVSLCYGPTLAKGPFIAQNWVDFIASHNQFQNFTSNGVITNNSAHLFSGIISTGFAATNVNLYGDLYYASGGSVTHEPSQETWHQITGGQFKNGWSNAGTDSGFNSAPLSYRRISSPPNSVQIIGTLTYQTNSNTIFTLPSAYTPVHAQRIAHDSLGYFLIGTDGTVSCNSNKAQQLNVTPVNIGINGIYSLDI